MSTNYKATQLKVIIGYVLLILLLVYSVNYIYQKMNILTESETYEDKLNEQRRITYRVLSQLYQAEVIGQSVSAGQQSEFRRYQCALDSSRQAIEDLQAIQSDEIQANRLDTIVFLLKRKEWNMYNLLQAMNEANTGQIYQQKIERIIQRQDTLTVPRPQENTAEGRRPREILRGQAETSGILQAAGGSLRASQGGLHTGHQHTTRTGDRHTGQCL